MDMREKILANRALDLRIATEVLGQSPPFDFDHSGVSEWTREADAEEGDGNRIRILRWPPFYTRDTATALLLVCQLQAAYGLDGGNTGPVHLSIQAGTWYAAYLVKGADVAWSTDDDLLIALCKAALELRTRKRVR